MADGHTPPPTDSLEEALAAVQSEVESALAAAGKAVKDMKALRKAAQEGDIRRLEAALSALPQTVEALDEQCRSACNAWDFDVEGHLESGGYARELLGAAAAAGVRVFEQDDRLYCYPSLVRVLAGEQCVEIDKQRERRLRPGLIVERLEKGQDRPPRYKPEAYLNCLFEAYKRLNPKQKGAPEVAGKVSELADIYSMLTLLPGQSKEYGRAEFARDIYLLDESGVSMTRSGVVATLHLDRGATRRSISVITRTGEQKHYLGISFTKPA